MTDTKRIHDASNAVISLEYWRTKSSLTIHSFKHEYYESKQEQHDAQRSALQQRRILACEDGIEPTAQREIRAKRG